MHGTRGRRCLDVWEDEGRQPNLDGDEVLVAPLSSIIRMFVKSQDPHYPFLGSDLGLGKRILI